MSNRSTTASDSADSVQDAGDETAYMKMVEAGHIGFQLAEEVRSLRESILALKQEKRLLLVNNENLEECVAQSNTVISSLRAKVEEQHRYIEAYSSEASQQEKIAKKLEIELKELKKQASAERKKSKLLGQELERSLEDEVALRGYSRRLESEAASLRERVQRQEEELRAEVEERVRCQKFIETALRSQLVLQKKLETVVYYCDKDVDLTAVSILDVTPDYLDNLLHDLRSDMLPQGSGGGAAAGKAGRFDFSSLEHKQRNIDHQQNQALNSIRAHAGKMRKTQHKSRKYIRALLDVIRTYEELPVTGGALSHAHHGHQQYQRTESECSSSDVESERRVSARSQAHGKTSSHQHQHRHPHHQHGDHEDHHPKHRHTQSSPEWRAGDRRHDAGRHGAHARQVGSTEALLREAQEALR